MCGQRWGPRTSLEHVQVFSARRRMNPRAVPTSSSTRGSDSALAVHESDDAAGPAQHCGLDVVSVDSWASVVLEPSDDDADMVENVPLEKAGSDPDGQLTSLCMVEPSQAHDGPVEEEGDHKGLGGQHTGLLSPTQPVVNTLVGSVKEEVTDTNVDKDPPTSAAQD